MAGGLIGRKLGMTRVFADDGASVAVTVLGVADNRVAQVKTPASDGYSALQIAFGSRKQKRLSRALIGHLAKSEAGPAAMLREFRVSDEAAAEILPGAELGAEMFEVGQFVDVAGISKGKGFAGVIKRHHFSSNRMSHGNSRAHRKPGSIGQCQDPGRVFPGKKMPGRLGGERCTTQNLSVVRIDAERKLILVKGPVPGADGEAVVIKPAVKAKAKKG